MLPASSQSATGRRPLFATVLAPWRLPLAGLGRSKPALWNGSKIAACQPLYQCTISTARALSAALRLDEN